MFFIRGAILYFRLYFIRGVLLCQCYPIGEISCILDNVFHYRKILHYKMYSNRERFNFSLCISLGKKCCISLFCQGRNIVLSNVFSQERHIVFQTISLGEKYCIRQCFSLRELLYLKQCISLWGVLLYQTKYFIIGETLYFRPYISLGEKHCIFRPYI